MMMFAKRLAAALSAPFLLLVSLIKRAPPYRGRFPKARKWYRGALPGCVGSDGSRYYAYYKKGTSDKTAVYFGGGGASWNEYTAARPTTICNLIRNRECYYFPFVRYYMELGMTGLVAADDPRNPLNDWNAIYLPYATADFHIGQNDFPYRADKKCAKVLCHHGLANVRAALDTAPKAFFQAETVFIGGESAGSFAVAAWAPELARRFPACKRFVLLTDGGQMWYPGWKGILRDVWRVDPQHYERLREDGQLMRDWFIKLYEELGDRLTCLYSISPYDEVLSQYESKLSGDAYETTRETVGSFHRHLKIAVQDMLRAIPTFRAYIYNHGINEKTGSTAHTITRTPANLYCDKTDGLSVCEWLARALAGQDVPNVGLERLD